MTEEKTRSSPLPPLIGVLVFVFIMVEVVIFIFMGGSSAATEPNPIFGDFFPAMTILVIIILGVVFFLSIERTQKGTKNVGKSNT